MLIRKATLDDLEQLEALIVSNSKQWIEKNIYQWHEPCDIKELRKEITKECVFVMMDKFRMIGTFSIEPSEQTYPIQIDQSYHLYRIIVNPFYQSKNVEDLVFKHVRKKYGKRNPVLLDCWAGNEHIFDFYRHHQCNYMGDFPEKDYKISIFQVGNIHYDK
ncbi:MAG: hypothetical protein JXR88_03720 [Clostridia bacterium]|nr:hypothetical protein [Clostridia bacterium]